MKSLNIDYHDFNEAIDELEKRELIEVQFNHVRISEQVMATYFFYKIFIKDEILSFKTLLFTFFSSWSKRFSDTIIPSNNSFGYENVLKKISNTLDEYLDSVYSEEEKVIEFLSIFWFYKQTETLNYFHQKVKIIPEPENPVYTSQYERNEFVFNKNQTLNFLTDFFNYFTESYIPAIELAFEYCRKLPESLPELVRRIKEKLLFDDDDHRYDFQRQVVFLNLLITKFKEGRHHYVVAFFALARTFLSHHYEITKGGRGNSITFYQYPLPFYEVTKEFRKKIWLTLFENNDKYPKEVFSILKGFRFRHNKPIPEILEFDLSFLLPFIESNLKPELFEHIHYVHDLVSWLDNEDLEDRSYRKLKSKFTSKEYTYFRKLEWNRYKGKQDYDFEKYEDFEKLKEQDIRNSFLFKSPNEFTLLHEAVTNMLSIDNNSTWVMNKALDIIVEENFIHNNEIGIQLLSSIFNYFPDGLNPLYTTLKCIISKSEEWADRLWVLIKSWNHKQKVYWQFTFFQCLPKEFVNKFYYDELMLTVHSINQNCTLYFESFEKFQTMDSDLFVKILKVVVGKIENEGLVIYLGYNFFEKYSIGLSQNFDLLAKAYMQQERKDHHFDYSRDGLKAIIKIKPTFLIEYIRSFYTVNDNLHDPDTHTQLNFVWDLDDSFQLIEEASNLIIDNTHFSGIIEHPVIIFFNHLSEEQKIKAKQFILNYISKHNRERKRMNPIFDVLRYTMNDFLEEAFLHYLSLNIDVKDFEKISWRGNGGVYKGDVIIGDIHAKEWQKILEMVDKAENQLDLISVKSYIKERIGSESRNGEEERKMKFINPNK